MNYLPLIARSIIVVVSLLVLSILSPLIIEEIQGHDACPQLGPLPVCYLIGASYTAMALVALIAPRRLTWLFAVGWIPVFVLALSGTVLEFLSYSTCPRTSLGTPMCYNSLVISLIFIAAFMKARSKSET